MVHLLKLAFVLCREVPILVQKVSRLLAVMYILSASSNHLSFSSPCKILSRSQWASFFHQASIGTHLNYQFLSSQRSNGRKLMDSENSHATGASDIGNLLRIAPKSINDLDRVVQDFFKGLPSTNIICISFLEDSYSKLLKDLLFQPSYGNAWMLNSRLNSMSQPIVILRPVMEVLKVSKHDFEWLYTSKSRNWRCPWGSSKVVDKLAPIFTQIMEEVYSAVSFSVDERKLKIDKRLGLFLSDLEDVWFGPWKYMLLRDWSSNKTINSTLKKLSRDCKVDVNANLLRVFGDCLENGCEVEEYAKLSLNKGCYIGTVRSCSEDQLNGVEKFSPSTYHLMRETVKKMKKDSVNREPAVLVIDGEVQVTHYIHS